MLTVVFVAIFFALVFFISRNPGNFPPGPPGYPLIGNLLLYVKSKNFFQTLRDLRGEYGDVFCLKMGSKPIVYVAGQDALKEIFVKRGDITSDRPPSFISTVGDELGLIGSSGRIWREHRQFAAKTLRIHGMGRNSMETQVQDEVENLLHQVEKTNGQAFHIESYISVSICNIICRLAFGKQFDVKDENARRLFFLVSKGFSNPRIRLLDFFPFLKYIPGDLFGMEVITKNLMQVSDFLQNIINDHRGSIDENCLRDYVDEYLVEQKQQSRDPETTFTDEQLIITIRNFFVAGTETSAATICWAIIYLIRHPEIQDKMRAEIKSIVGPSQAPSFEHRAKLPYCQAVIAETQRAANVTPMSLPHVASTDFQYNGLNIPKGTTLFANLDSLSMDPEVFPNPTKFDPDRFLSPTGEFIGQDRIMPFSLGRRVCLGESLARLELFLFIVTLIQRFELKPAQEGSPPSLKGEYGVGFNPLPFQIRAVKLY